MTASANPNSHPAPKPTGLRGFLPELTALSYRAYRLWWLSSASVMLNQYMTQITLAWQILELTDSAAWVSLGVFAFGVPSFILTLPAGAIADRWDRRKLMLTSQVVALINALVLAMVVATGLITRELALLFAMISGATVAMSQPARQSMIPLLLPRPHLMNGIVLGSMSQSLSQMVGPAIAGVLIAVISISAAFFGLAVMLIIGIVALVMLQVPEQETGNKPPFRLTEMLGGVGFLWAHKPLLIVAALYLATGIWIVGPIQALVPVLVRDYYHVGASSLGFAYTAQAIGAVGTSFWLTRQGGISNKGGIFAGSMMLGAIGLGGYGISPFYSVALIFFFIFGCATSLYSNMSQTILQTHSPQEVLGRVLSIISLSIQGFIPLGALQAGLIASAFDARIAAVYGSIVALALAMTAFTFAKEFRRLD